MCQLHSGEQHVRRRKSAEASSLPLGSILRTSGFPHPGLAQTGPSKSAGRVSLRIANSSYYLTKTVSSYFVLVLVLVALFLRGGEEKSHMLQVCARDPSTPSSL